MQSENRIFDDLTRMASGALSTLTGVRQEVETRIREQVERVLDRMNLVRREEFEVVQAMAAKARAEQERLAERLAQLEAKLAPAPSRQPPRPESGPSGGDASSLPEP